MQHRQIQGETDKFTDRDQEEGKGLQTTHTTKNYKLYVDKDPDFAAREYVGYFTVAQVRERLHQPPSPEKTSARYWERMQDAAELRRAGINSLEEIISVDSETHYRSGCACNHLHSRCGGPFPLSGSETTQIPGVTNNPAVYYLFEDLRSVAKASCWFCLIIYGGMKASPHWDASRSETTPFLSSNKGIYLSL
jgi:hypothetical protein